MQAILALVRSRDIRPKFPDTVPQALQLVSADCWGRSPGRRPVMSEARARSPLRSRSHLRARSPLRSRSLPLASARSRVPLPSSHARSLLPNPLASCVLAPIVQHLC